MATKLLSKPISPSPEKDVELFVGDERQILRMSRPTRFSSILLVSDHKVSKRTEEFGPVNIRQIAKRAISKWAPPIKLDRFFNARIYEPNNIAHLVNELIPLCLLAKEAAPDAKFIFRPLLPIFRDLLRHFGIEPISTYRPVEGQEITPFLTRELAIYSLRNAFDCPLITLTGNVYGDLVRKTAGQTKIYLSRRGDRALTNEAEISVYLETRGYKTFYMEDYSIAEQIAIVQAAEDVVAIHGAAMGYLSLAPHLRSVVEFLPPNVYHSYYPVALADKVDRFVQLMPSFDENVLFGGWGALLEHKQHGFGVDLRQLERALGG